MDAEKELKVCAPLEAFRPGDFVRVCSPWSGVLPDTYLVVGCRNASDEVRLVGIRSGETEAIISGSGPMRFDEVAVDLYERDKRLNAPR